MVFLVDRSSVAWRLVFVQTEIRVEFQIGRIAGSATVGCLAGGDILAFVKTKIIRASKDEQWMKNSIVQMNLFKLIDLLDEWPHELVEADFLHGRALRNTNQSCRVSLSLKLITRIVDLKVHHGQLSVEVLVERHVHIVPVNLESRDELI